MVGSPMDRALFVPLLEPPAVETLPVRFCLLIVVVHASPTLCCMIQRLEATTRSPVFSQLSETLDGLVTIRAFGNQRQSVVDLMSVLNLTFVLDSASVARRYHMKSCQ